MRNAVLTSLVLSTLVACAAPADDHSETHRAAPLAKMQIHAPQLATFAREAVLARHIDAPSSGDHAPSRRLVAYWASWTSDVLPVAKIDWSKVTHVAHAFVLPSKTGGLANVAGYVNAELVTTAHAHGVKVVASVGGWGAKFDANLDPAMRAKTVSALASLCKTDGYDGIDIDWEYPTATTGPAWASLVTELRTALDAVDPSLTISAAVSGSPSNLADLPKKGVDALSWIGVMTYDFAGPWSPSTGHHAPLHDSVGGDGGSTASAVAYVTGTMKVPADKVLFGLPFYGYQFAANALDAAPVAPSNGLDYNTLAPLVGTGGWKRVFDAKAGVPYLTRPASPGFVTYEDDVSVKGKCAWSTSQGLGGAIVWHLAGDRMPDGSQPLLAAAQSCR